MCCRHEGAQPVALWRAAQHSMNCGGGGAANATRVVYVAMLQWRAEAAHGGMINQDHNVCGGSIPIKYQLSSSESESSAIEPSCLTEAHFERLSTLQLTDGLHVVSER